MERENIGRYVGYEYKEVKTDRAQASFLIDGYANFGWQVDENVTGGVGEERANTPKSPASDKLVIRLKRDRKIINKVEFTRLQRNFEACVREIAELERRKTSAATSAAIAAGVAGTVFMAGSTFAVTAQQPHILLCVVLAIPGFLGWILPYFLYKRMSKAKTEEISPLIEEKYDEIYEICEKGNRLLHG